MGRINLPQTATPNVPAASTDNIFIDTSGNLSVQKPDGNIVKIAAAGTYTLTIPATGTAALLGTAQTFSAAQTFSVNPIMSGVRPPVDGLAAFRIFKADNTTPVLAVDTTNSRVLAPALSSATADIADDAVITLTGAFAVGVLLLWVSRAGGETGQESGLIKYRAASSPHCVALAAGSLVNVTTSDVTGTTGTDGRITISATNGALKIENRLGGVATTRWQIFA